LLRDGGTESASGWLKLTSLFKNNVHHGLAFLNTQLLINTPSLLAPQGARRA
jgi:hypothetical protein